MKSEQVSRMAEAATGMLEVLTGSRPVLGQLGALPELSTGYQINAVSNLSGSLEGTVVYGMSIITADRLASLITGQPVVTFDKPAACAICLFGGRVSGAIAGALLELGYPIEVQPAVIIRGSNVQVATVGSPTIVIPLGLEGFGQIEIRLAIRDRAEVSQAA